MERCLQAGDAVTAAHPCCAWMLPLLVVALGACSGTDGAAPSSSPTVTEPDNAASPAGPGASTGAGSSEQPASRDDAGPLEAATATDAGPLPDDSATMTEDSAPPADTATSVAEPKCGEPPAEPPSAPVTAPSTKFPEIKHWEMPSSDVVALTFDDGPLPATTDKILDVLKAEKVRATFFINSRASTDLRTNVAAQATLRRIVAEGHVLGNHTASHYDLRTASVDVEAQLAFVESDIKLAAPCAPPITLVRTPFGQPHLAGTDEEKARVLPIIARHGVHVGWTIETLDYECNDLGPACVVDRLKKRLNLGKRGAILMHDTQKVTVDALPLVIAELRARGLGMVTAEKLVRDKYGKTSAELVTK